MAYRILQIGQFMSPQYDEAIATGFEKLGHIVYRFKHYGYTNSLTLFNKIQNKLLYGPSYWKLWQDVLEVAETFKPDIIFYRRLNELPPNVLNKLRTITRAVLVSYQNDDPFGPDRNKQFFKNFHATIPIFDIHFVFRELNVKDFERNGAKNVEVLLPYYVTELHHPSVLTDEESVQLQTEALFLGHGEDDNRLDAFDALTDSDIKLTLGGSGFEQYAKNRSHSRSLPAKYFGKEIYAKALQTANCSLCFFSKLNRDVMTFRVFEIPACSGVLVSERNETVQRFFKDREEAYFFSSTEELVNIVSLLKNNRTLRDEIAIKGYNRIMSERHEVIDRVRQIISTVEKI